MIAILIALIVVLVTSVNAVRYSAKGDTTLHIIGLILGGTSLIFSVTALFLYLFVAWDWFAAEHKARVINEEFGTSYTQEEVFWASDVIDEIRELKRQRIELNGDLLREGS